MRLAVEEFRHFEYPEWFRLLIGGIELICGLVLLAPRTSSIAAVALCLVMAGAVATHVAFGEFALASVPLSLVFMLGTTAWTSCQAQMTEQAGGEEACK